MNEFIKHVNDVCHTVNSSISSVNRGGCAVFASLMGQCLQKYGNVAIAVASDVSTASVDEVRCNNIDTNSLDEWTDNGVSFSHVIIELTYNGVKYHIDSTGVSRAALHAGVGRWPILDGRLTVEETTSIASYTDWNRRFDRRQIPKMKKQINEGFERIFNRLRGNPPRSGGG